MSWRDQAKCQCRCGSNFVHIEGSAAVGGATDYLCWARVSRIFSAEIAIKHEKNRVSEHPQIRAPVETLARGLKIYAVGGLTRHAGKCAAADPEGFAHSAAAEGRRVQNKQNKKGGLGIGCLSKLVSMPGRLGRLDNRGRQARQIRQDWRVR